MRIARCFQRLFGRAAEKDDDVKHVEFIYVNQDGTARELSLDERDYLLKDFAGADGARPYIKNSYTAVDGWGSLSGFLRQRDLPSSITVMPVNPDYKMPTFNVSDFTDLGGDLETVRRKRLERQRAEERRASGPGSA